MRPLVLLDVDGVLNALGPPDGSWDDWRYGSAAALGRDWPIRFSPTVVAAVRGWTETADVNWLTTWGHEANTGLGDLLGLAELPVAGTPDGPTEPLLRLGCHFSNAVGWLNVKALGDHKCRLRASATS